MDTLKKQRHDETALWEEINKIEIEKKQALYLLEHINEIKTVSQVKKSYHQLEKTQDTLLKSCSHLRKERDELLLSNIKVGVELENEFKKTNNRKELIYAGKRELLDMRSYLEKIQMILASKL